MSANGKTALDFLGKLLERARAGTDNCDQIMLTVRLIVKATLFA